MNYLTDINIFFIVNGKKLAEYIAEAKRYLATIGYLLIGETTKAMKGRLSNHKEVIRQHGFDNI